MTRKGLIAEITTKLKQYDESGLIDYKSLNRWIKNELKRFGSNLMVLTEKVLEVENGIATLPENFFSLDLAVKCSMDSYEIREEHRDVLQSSHFWTQRLETTYEWNNTSNSHVGKDYKCIREEVYYKGCPITLRYNDVQPLKLVKGIKKESCSKKCKNFNFNNSPYEINILRDKIQTNFSKGSIYIQYYGLPSDDEGDLEIPDIVNLQEYLIAYCTRQILESLWFNDDDVNLVNKLNYIRQSEESLFTKAMTTVKFEALGKNWDKKIKRKIIAESNRYERMFPGY